MAIGFVVGTGRSGTHWLGWTLESHPSITVTIEQEPIFGRVTAAALDLRKQDELMSYLARRYRYRMLRAWPSLYVDKSHPNLWHVEPLGRRFPNAKFIAVRRGVEATVASMLRHEGVMQWHRDWRSFPVPNPFLGITAEVATDYENLSMAARCALRWKAHSDEIDRLANTMRPVSFLVLEYEQMMGAYAETCSRIWSFLGLADHQPALEIRAESLDRWRTELTGQDLIDISDSIGRVG